MSDLIEIAPEHFDDASIARVVHTFYERVRADPELAPVFERRIERWEEHLGRMVAFWTTVLRSEPAYVRDPRGGPPALHRAITELSTAHFARWLELFAATTSEVLDPPRAAHMQQRAARMARALSAHLPGSPESPRPLETLRAEEPSR